MEADIVPAMPRRKGELTDEQKQQIEEWAARLELAKGAYRRVVLDALDNGASFSEVSRETGLSTNTLQRWKREAR